MTDNSEDKPLCIDDGLFFYTLSFGRAFILDKQNK